MKTSKASLRRWRLWLFLLWLSCACNIVWATTTTFTFTLDEPCKTSAGVFKPDGTLIRTLWSKVRYQAGTNSAVWDGLDDETNAAPEGIYEIRLLQHNTEYVWDGAIGNTSAELSGPTVHHGFWPIRDIAISGTNAFYVSGYNEGGYDFRSFVTTEPQRVKASWFWVFNEDTNKSAYSIPGTVYDLNWLWTVSDSNRVYFACSATTDPYDLRFTTNRNNRAGCIVSCDVSDNGQADFTNGIKIDLQFVNTYLTTTFTTNVIGNVTNIDANTVTNPYYVRLKSGIYAGTQPGLSGLGVQQNGNLLAASVAPDNRVYLKDKITGAELNDFYVSVPKGLSFSSDGSLWVISSNLNSVICYTNLSISPAVAVTISNLVNPLAVAVNPNNPNLILVADGGSSQQVKAFDSTGNSVWIYGQAGGYQTNGVAVTTNKFWFFDGENDGTFLSYAPDGSFWVGDGANHRCLHFSAARNFLEQIMCQPHTRVACVDQNNPSRVFNEFLEFNVDYSKPLPQAWTLVNNWKANIDTNHILFNQGLYEITTFTNGRTYGLIDKLEIDTMVTNAANTNGAVSAHAIKELCELGTNQLRLTGIFPIITTNQGRWVSLGSDGSARATVYGEAKWYQSTLTGFDASNNPTWNPETLIATASEGKRDPVPRTGGLGNIRTTISTNNILISFDQSLNNGWHLGGVRVGATSWLWKASPAVTYMDGLGTYEISNGVNYAGNTLQVVDRNVMFGYHGEYFRNQWQAAQTMHFYDDGLFVGQFGEATIEHHPYEGALPGSAGNGGAPSLTKTASGDYYMWVNDGADHGPQRWHFVNARNIREQSGSGSLGSTITLTNPPLTFPVGLSGKNGNQSGELSWQPVPGATSYNIRYSLLNGGPFNTLAGNTTNTHFVAGGLSNGQTYYFAVTVNQDGNEGIPSEQIAINPFDTNLKVICAGSMSDGSQLIRSALVRSNAPASGQPSLIGISHIGLLNLRELDYCGFGTLQNEFVGTKGYEIYDWSYGFHYESLTTNFSISSADGWHDDHARSLRLIFTVDNFITDTNVAGWGIEPLFNPQASLGIHVSDTNFHYLTVFSPANSSDSKKFTLSLASANVTSSAFTVNESIGYSDVFQFLFRGDVTLWSDAAGGTNGIIQAVFFDDAPVTYLPPTTNNPAKPIVLTGATMLGNGAFQFSFSNDVSSSFTVTSATNLATPLSQWTVVGQPTYLGSGLFQFTSLPATNEPQRFYRVRSP